MSSNFSLLFIVISTEIRKLRNTVALWLTLLYPLFSVLLSSMVLYSGRSDSTPDHVNFINDFNNLVAFFLPFHAVLMVSFFCQVEHRNFMLKHLYSLPVPKWAFYYGKLAASFLLLAVSWLLMLIFVYLAFIMLGIQSAKLRITPSFEHAYLIMLLSRTFLSAAALVVVQYLISLKLKNVVAPIAIGTSLIILPIAMLIVLGITGVIKNPNVLKLPLKYNPYSYPFSYVFKASHGGNLKMELFSLTLVAWTIFAIVLAIVGYVELKRRNIK